MDLIGTIDELEDALKQMLVNGVQLSFGPSASPLRKGQWFASVGGGETCRQVRGPTLRDALNALVGRQDVVDVITEPVKATVAPATLVTAMPVAAIPTTSLSDLLL